MEFFFRERLDKMSVRESVLNDDDDKMMHKEAFVSKTLSLGTSASASGSGTLTM